MDNIDGILLKTLWPSEKYHNTTVTARSLCWSEVEDVSLTARTCGHRRHLTTKHLACGCEASPDLVFPADTDCHNVVCLKEKKIQSCVSHLSRILLTQYFSLYLDAEVLTIHIFKCQTKLQICWPKIQTLCSWSVRVLIWLSPSFWHVSLALWHQLSLLFLSPSLPVNCHCCGVFLSIFDVQLSLLCLFCTACPLNSVGGTLKTVSRYFFVDEVSITSTLMLVASQSHWLFLWDFVFLFFLHTTHTHVNVLYISTPCCPAMYGCYCWFMSMSLNNSSAGIKILVMLEMTL